ncbi:3-oxoacyl-[acyl-carrier-protein] synthase III C-terminal domain-containing protein [Chroococcidiopsis sp. TS-821]|uniref:3-oxoacyl-[acyl-carrier-protein] synthase III C-terminal domain-containing protein n=1 Tax=Chroococcidiopsis sp. TS-821 TaxID=1378066 RepID=UPI000CEE6245|nr:3-oxoacyl-[acyl-carrier-protein] synthase III C-terminal domain-containing protein [Chroococcidiopsis sp. TS-821]PPS41249.1 3-oxoacyl-ACP synthase [Chroococcidiopsis sp. TS-821]
MTTPSVGIRSLAISFPQTTRTNDYWLAKFPQLGNQTQRQARLPQLTSSENGLDIWLQEVAPYLSDPFRGSVGRRVLASNESSLTLECRAAQAALSSAQLTADEVDLAIVASLFPDTVGPGLAALLARELGLRCPAWNLESTCASALIALQTAQAFIQTGVYHRVLIVVSHIGSRCVNDEDTLSWSMGDGAGAFIVGSVKPNQGILSTKIVSTSTTYGAYVHELVVDAQGKPRIQTRTGENASSLAETAVDCIRHCCQEAVKAAGVSLDQISVFAVNTPTAWYASVCAKALGIDPQRVMNLYPLYANIGPVYSVANLYHAVTTGKLGKDDLVLVYANGAGATAAATVMRWGDVAISSTDDSSTIAQQATSVVATPPHVDPVRLPAAVNPEERYAFLEAYLCEWLAHSTQRASAQLHSHVLLSTLLDSLLAIALRSRIESDLKVRVPMEKFFGETTIADLVKFLCDQLVVTEIVNSKTATSTSAREIVHL